MMADLVSMYQKGAVTADHLVAETLHRVDPENPGLVLAALPGDILARILTFAQGYRPEGMVTNYGPLPAADQVDAARAWIEGSRTTVDDDDLHDGADWDRYQMEARINEILGAAPFHPSHETGRFFMTAYQIAIGFARRFEDDFRKMGRPIGGAGAGNKALSKYIATQLARRIKAGTLPSIEIQFLSSMEMKALSFKYCGKDIVATPNDAGYPNSLYRLK
jgi:hypothetical protein